jgi:hypothetical protein
MKMKASNRSSSAIRTCIFRRCGLVAVAIFLNVIATGNQIRAEEKSESATVEALRTDWFPILPWDRTQLLNGPAERVRGLASLSECNFTIAGFPRAVDLKACEKLGLKGIVYPDDALGLINPKHLSDEQIVHAVKSLAEATRDSPACIGYYIRDEPGASQFAYLGKIVAAVRKYAPGKLAYINLFPSYASAGLPGKSQLEAKSFTEYLERYVAETKPQFLSYDNYMVGVSKDLRNRQTGARYFHDLLEVRRVAMKNGLPFWNIVCCNQIRPNATPPSPANLLLQAWTTLAAGGHGVSWYKYVRTTYHFAPLDARGGRTATWLYVQMVNRQLKAIGPIVIRLRSIGVYFTNPAPLDQAPNLPGKLVTKIDADGPLMIGEFASKGEEVDHVVLVNVSLERTTLIHLKDLAARGTLEEYSSEDGHLGKCDAEYYLPAGQGVLLKVSR